MMNAFETLISDFAEKAGLSLQTVKDGSVDLVVDGIDVSVQYRPDNDDCVLFTLPLDDTEPDDRMARRALELSANGAGTGGHFLGIKEGMFVLSSIAQLGGLSAEDFAERLLALAAATRRVAEALALAVAEGVAEDEEAKGPTSFPAADGAEGGSSFDAIRV